MATQWLKNLSHKAAHVKMLNPVYTASLGRPQDPLEFTSFPQELFPGDAGRGRWVASGQIDINGHRQPIDFEHWYIGGDIQATPFFEKLHGFDFLSELKSLGGDEGRKAARDIMQAWLNDFSNYHHIVWAPDLTAQRLVNWLIVYPFAFETATDDFLESLHLAFYRQYQHLNHLFQTNTDADVFDRYASLWALIIVQCHCNDFYDELGFASCLQLLKGTVEDMVLSDHGLIARNPQNLTEFARSLIRLRHSLMMASHKSPLWLDKTLENTIRIAGSLLHSDKDFPLFQGAILPNKREVEAVIKQSGVRLRKKNMNYPDYGYTAIHNHRTSLMIDHGLQGDHMAPLAFELSFGTNRIMTSCGHHTEDAMWRESLSYMAAHNALMINGEEPKQSILNLKTNFENLNGAALFSGSHEGYNAAYGLTHTRRLYLDDSGEDFRGEELLTRNIALKPLQTTIRFHLHPTVKAAFIENKTAILLRLTNGSGWIFKCQGNEDLLLEESVYCGDGVTVRKTYQIVVHAAMEDLSHQMKWALKKQ